MKSLFLGIIIFPIFCFSQQNGDHDIVKQSVVNDSIHYETIELQINQMEADLMPAVHLKSGSVNGQRPDSTHFYQFKTPADSVLTKKSLFTYDASGKLKTEHQWIWDLAGIMKSDIYYEYFYNRTNKISTRQINGWYTYRDTSYISLGGKYVKQDTLIQVPIKNSTDYYNYNTAGRLTSYHFIRLDYIFPHYDSYQYSYDKAGNKILATNILEKSTDHPSYEEKYTYDANKNLLTLTISNYERYNYIPVWFCYSSTKYEYVYDTQNRVSSVLAYYWSYNANNWIYASKVDYIYDENGLLKTRLYSIMDAVRKEVVQANRAEYIYNKENNLRLKAEYYWNKSSQKWVIAQKEYSYYYSASDPAIKSNAIADDELADESFWKIFPNPARDILQIENSSSSISEARLYNNMGQLIEIWHLEKGKNTIRISHLRKGIYTIQLPFKERMETFQFIKSPYN